MLSLDEVIRKHIKETKAKQKQAYNANQQWGVKFSFAAGDHMLLRNSLNDDSKLSKGGQLTAGWTGKYTVKTILAKGLCILSDSGGKELKSKQNIARLKPYAECPAHDVVQQQPGTIDASTVDEDAADVGHSMLCFIHLTNHAHAVNLAVIWHIVIQVISLHCLTIITYITMYKLLTTLAVNSDTVQQ